jgi:hypothetical protein
MENYYNIRNLDIQIGFPVKTSIEAEGLFSLYFNL